MSCPPAASKSLETGPLTYWTDEFKRRPGTENLITDTFPGPVYPENDNES